MDHYRQILINGIETLNLPVTDDKIEGLLKFVSLIDKWNHVYNLTAVRNQEEMIRLHLLDSLTVIPHIEGNRIIDIGTGAGLPGIPLAVYCPERDFTLLDSNAKKTRFVQQAVLELGLKNVSVIHKRVEQFQPEQKFDAVITRAFTDLSNMLKQIHHLLIKKGLLLAMKGHRPDAELAEIAMETTVIPIVVPGLESHRCLVKISMPDQ